MPVMLLLVINVGYCIVKIEKEDRSFILFRNCYRNNVTRRRLQTIKDNITPH